MAPLQSPQMLLASSGFSLFSWIYTSISGLRIQGLVLAFALITIYCGLSYQFHYFFYRPNVIRYSRYHSECSKVGIGKALMRPCEVVVHEVAYSWFSSFFEKALVSLVKRLIPIRIVRLWRSTKLVDMSVLSGLPLITCLSAPIQVAGQ